MNRFGINEDLEYEFPEDEEELENVYEVTLAKKKDMINRKKANNADSKRPAEFSLTPDNIEFPMHCPVLGIPLAYKREVKARSEASPSFDRLDPTRGYTSENTRIISWRANRIKNDGTAEEHRKIYEFMIKHQKP